MKFICLNFFYVGDPTKLKTYDLPRLQFDEKERFRPI